MTRRTAASLEQGVQSLTGDNTEAVDALAEV